MDQRLQDYSFYSKIAEEVGDPFYLFDRQRFQENIDSFRGAFQRYYSDVTLAHSYKTNYTPTICRIAKRQGLYAEVVSGLEYSMALRAGYSPECIIFNGPIKTRDDLCDALLKGSMVNVDHLAEVSEVCKIAKAYRGTPISLGVRCNADYGAPVRSRFGMSEDGGELAEAFSRLTREPNINVAGIHIHTSAIRTPESYRRRANFAIDIVNSYFEKSQPKYINLGGGFPGIMPQEILRQLGMEQTDFNHYAEAICDPLASAFSSLPSPPKLILEPGLALFANIFRLCTSVLAIKKINNRFLAVLSGGIHTVKPTGHGLNMPLTHLSKVRGNGVEHRWDLSGYTCMEHDILYEGFSGCVEVGDKFLFDQVGAYTTVFKPPFILPAPPIVECIDGKIHLLRRRESVDQMLAMYEESE